MSVFDEAKDKAQQFASQGKEKFGQQNQDEGDQQNDGMSGDLRGKAEDAVRNAKERFGN